jgi:hypothetical protein
MISSVIIISFLPHRTLTNKSLVGAFMNTANLVLEDTVERIYHQDVYAERKNGLFLIRGENVVLLGEIVCSSML